MKRIISSLHFAWGDLDECFTRARDELQLDGVELSFDARHERPGCTQDDIANMREVNEAHGLSLAAHIWENVAQLGRDKAAEALLGWLAVCGQTGVETIVVHGGSYPHRREGIARTRRAFERIVGAFEAAGVVLCLENHYAYDYRECCELFSEVWEFAEVFSIESLSLRFCFDTGHAHMTGNSEALLRELAPQLSHVHLADNRGIDDDHMPYRSGTVDWDSVLGALRRIGFDGVFCVEFPVRDDLGPFARCMADLSA